MATPTAEQVKAYVDELPAIYRDLLAAFQTATPGRRHGEGVNEGTLRNHLYNQGKRYDEEEVWLALTRLVESGFLNERDSLGWFSPTPLGEELVAALTGVRARPITVPDLPKPTW